MVYTFVCKWFVSCQLNQVLSELNPSFLLHMLENPQKRKTEQAQNSKRESRLRGPKPRAVAARAYNSPLKNRAHSVFFRSFLRLYKQNPSDCPQSKLVRSTTHTVDDYQLQSVRSPPPHTPSENLFVF